MCAATYRGIPVPHSSSPTTRGAAGSCQVFGLTLRRIATSAVAAGPAEAGGNSDDVLSPAIPLFGRSNVVAFGASTSVRGGAGSSSSARSGLPVQFCNRRVQCRSNIFCVPGRARGSEDASGRPARVCVAVGDDSDNSVLLWDVNERRVRQAKRGRGLCCDIYTP